MKKIIAIITGVCTLCGVFNASAQHKTDVKAVPPYTLAVTYNKTTSLIFPYAIKSVDRGSRNVLVQKAIGVENILQVKAAKPGFAETNLTVVTADGSLYPYVIRYTDSPADLSLQFRNAAISPKPVAIFDKDATTDEIALRAKDVAARKRVVKDISDSKYGMELDVKGIYVHGETMYFQVVLRNNSSIDYDVQSLRFYLHDQKRSRRTASQDIELTPDYKLGNDELVKHSSEQTICIALAKFTIPDKKYLAVELMEKSGGRHLGLRIKNKKLTASKVLL